MLYAIVITVSFTTLRDIMRHYATLQYVTLLHTNSIMYRGKNNVPYILNLF